MLRKSYIFTFLKYTFKPKSQGEKMKKLIKFSLVTALAASFANAAVYVFDPAHRNVGFNIKQLSI